MCKVIFTDLLVVYFYVCWYSAYEAYQFPTLCYPYSTVPVFEPAWWLKRPVVYKTNITDAVNRPTHHADKTNEIDVVSLLQVVTCTFCGNKNKIIPVTDLVFQVMKTSLPV